VVSETSNTESAPSLAAVEVVTTDAAPVPIVRLYVVLATAAKLETYTSPPPPPPPHALPLTPEPPPPATTSIFAVPVRFAGVTHVSLPGVVWLDAVSVATFEPE